MADYEVNNCISLGISVPSTWLTTWLYSMYIDQAALYNLATILAAARLYSAHK